MMKNFGGSIVFTIVALLVAAGVGYTETGLVSVALLSLFRAGVLGVMETSLSLDNAVVNSKVLETMDEKWRHRFLTWGMFIAVGLMRVLFPLIIVSVAGRVGLIEAGRIALFNHELYEQIVTSAHVGIGGFGGTFLLLVTLSFFVDGEKEHHWVPFLEKPLMSLERIPAAVYVLAAILVGLASFGTEGAETSTFLLASLAGAGSFFVIKKGGDLLEKRNEAGVVIRSGAASFLYLEFLDASFSFDGVIGAFAITNDILIIALGLGIGAMFVRSMTLALVRGGHLSEYRFLEHGAFWAIAALAAIMLAVHVEVPEVVTGLIGAVLIGSAWLYSKRHRATHPEEYVGDEEGEAVLPAGQIVGTAA